MIANKANPLFHSAPECPSFTVDGSKQESWAASTPGTTVTIECTAKRILVGSATVTCQYDGTWSSEARCDEVCKLQGYRWGDLPNPPTPLKNHPVRRATRVQAYNFGGNLKN